MPINVPARLRIVFAQPPLRDQEGNDHGQCPQCARRHQSQAADKGPGRQPGYLRLEDFELVGNSVKVTTDLVDLTQLERVLVSHPHVLEQDGFRMVLNTAASKHGVGSLL